MAHPEPSPARVAFLGTGIMGAPMAASLAEAGFEVIAFNRTPSRARELAASHPRIAVAASAAEAARASTGLVVSMVPDGPDVEAVLLGEGGAAEGLAAGALAIDMSTIAPASSRAIGARLGEREIAFLDAPVTGSRPKAVDGTLTIMAGGEPDAFERARPLFAAMGHVVVHAGPQGHGSLVKLINNTLAAVNAAALAEGLVLAEAAGVDSDRLLEVVAAGSGDSAMRAIKAAPMVARDFEPLFKLEHMLKDVRHMLRSASELGVDAELAQRAEAAYAEAAAAGLADADFAAVIETIRTKSGLK